MSLSPFPSVLTTLKTSVKKELRVSVIHYRNFSGCKGDRWDTNTDSINKINPSATINCICACLLSLGFFLSVQTDRSSSRQCYTGLRVYLLADKFVKPRKSWGLYKKVTTVLSLSSLCQCGSPEDKRLMSQTLIAGWLWDQPRIDCW